ncbi:AbrB/MazE/SpoVT family DNA-binding domain-containing protein [Pseudomonas syringae]|uniref:AbrB/MazE/SpoVT family DNA-binding domain-containing protein n=1 Tax=Pseudomonas syringae TaxID=317 RepID=UPI0013C2AE88
MRTQIRRVGNSAGVVIPAMMLKEVNVEVGTSIDLTVVNGVFIAKPVIETRKRSTRSSITLESLISNYIRFEDEVFLNSTEQEVIYEHEPNSKRSRKP